LRRFLSSAFPIILLGLALSSTGHAEEKLVIWTGWFSDSKCALARAAAGVFSETNPECAKTCIEKGSAPVFISEQARAVFAVQDYASVIADLGYRIELRGMADEDAKTIRVRSLKRLEYQGPACTRPRKK
jgi:hypothetical protein